MINVPEQFRPHIRVDYPPNNQMIFEEWFHKSVCQMFPCGLVGWHQGVREYLPVFWTPYHVNNDYGHNPIKRKLLQDFIDSLPRGKKYFTIVQYDDGCLVDFKDLDILIFNMSTEGFPIPLTCMDHPYAFNVERDLLYSYVGSNTHPIRRQLKQYTNKRLDIKEYCQLHARSVFSLCPRGYGINSFRIKEALQYGAIPVYISDKFIEPFNIDFDEYGLKINEAQIPMLEQILKSFSPADLETKRQRGLEVFKEFYQYEGLRDKILQNI
jgi:hypothetical protein